MNSFQEFRELQTRDLGEEGRMPSRDFLPKNLDTPFCGGKDRATKTPKELSPMGIMGGSAKLTTIIVIALVGCMTSFAATDWDDDPDTPDAVDIVMAQPATLAVQILARKRAQIPRTIDRNNFAPILNIQPGAMPSLNFYSSHKQVRERAPPPLVQRK